MHGMFILRFFANGLHVKGGELVGPSKLKWWRYAFLLFYYVLQKAVFRPVDIACAFKRFCFLHFPNTDVLTQTCPISVWGPPRPILEHFRVILTKNTPNIILGRFL